MRTGRVRAGVGRAGQARKFTDAPDCTRKCSVPGCIWCTAWLRCNVAALPRGCRAHTARAASSARVGGRPSCATPRLTTKVADRRVIARCGVASVAEVASLVAPCRLACCTAACTRTLRRSIGRRQRCMSRVRWLVTARMILCSAAARRARACLHHAQLSVRRRGSAKQSKAKPSALNRPRLCGAAPLCRGAAYP